MCLFPYHLSKKTCSGFKCYDIPCGKCEECQKEKINGYLVRCMSDYLANDKRCSFVTLTYNPENLPFTTVYNESPVAVPSEYQHLFGELVHESSPFLNISCWDKSHISKLFKSLQQKAYNHIISSTTGIPRKIGKSINPEFLEAIKNYRKQFGQPVKYLCVCERGSDHLYMYKGRPRKGTSRPHYHAFVCGTHSLITSEWLNKSIHSLWTYGFSYNVGLHRSPNQAINYIVKYVCKHQDFNYTPGMFLSYEDKKLHNCSLSISNHLGSSLFDKFNDDFEHNSNILQDGYTVASSKNASFTVNYPRYVLDKLLKTQIDNPKSYVSRSDKTFQIAHSQKRYDELVFDGSISSVTTYKDMPDVGKCSILTPMGEYYLKVTQSSKTNAYLDLFKKALTYPECFNPPAYINNVNYYNFAYFLEQELNITIDPNSHNNLILDESNINQLHSLTYLYLRNIKNKFKKDSLLKHKEHYKTNLAKALSESPQLFTNYDLLTNYEL